jgi:hypothetical protein
LGYADPFGDEFPSADFDFAEFLEKEPFSGDFCHAESFENDFAHFSTKTEALEGDAEVDFGAAGPFAKDALKRGYALENHLNRLKPVCSLKRVLQPQTNHRELTQGSSCGLFSS